MHYGISKKVEMGFEDALIAVREALGKEEFGVLTEIDVKGTMKKKLGADMEEYVILGACNPPFAHKALAAEQEIGLLLPCNVIVYKKDGDVYVSAIRPSVAMQMVTNPALREVAGEVEAKLERAIKSM